MKFIPSFTIVLFLVIYGCAPSTKTAEEIKTSKKIRGVSFVGSPERVDITAFADLYNNRVNYTSLMPFAFADNGAGELIWPIEGQWWGETAEGIQVCIDLAKEKRIQSMIKPQIWLRGGTFVGKLDQPNDSAWVSFEKGYTEFILTFAKFSEKNRLPLFCIGTEVDQWVRKRPEYWRDLIRQVREVYKGDLIYAANWGSERSLPIWNDLNYIGVDMYAPVSNEQTPSMDTLNLSWKKWKGYFKNVSDSIGKEIIFTEWGYRSDDYCGRNPWSDQLQGKVNLEAQANCYKALIDNCYPEPWFMGGFVWKWFPDLRQAQMEGDHFTPQFKPAAKELQRIGK